MLKFFIKAIQLPIRLLNNKSNSNLFCFWNRAPMASVSEKGKLDLNVEPPPVKKMKVECDSANIMVERRTVATMCGAWRPEEVDGGLIFVFKTREACLSPDPTQESDYPENIQDFWEASLINIDNEQ